MTDLFKCRKSGTQCCAPKSVIRDHLDKKNANVNQRNDTVTNSGNDNYQKNVTSSLYNTKYSPSPQIINSEQHTTHGGKLI